MEHKHTIGSLQAALDNWKWIINEMKEEELISYTIDKWNIEEVKCIIQTIEHQQEDLKILEERSRLYFNAKEKCAKQLQEKDKEIERLKEESAENFIDTLVYLSTLNNVDDIHKAIKDIIDDN